MTYYKVWIEIEECEDETGEGHDIDLVGLLPFASSARCETIEDALEVAKQMHAAVGGLEVYP